MLDRKSLSSRIRRLVAVSGIFGTIMTYAMFFGISSYYSSHHNRVTNSALGVHAVKYAKRMDLMSWFFKEVTHNFPYIVAVFSISTTARGFWLMWDVQANYWGAAALAVTWYHCLLRWPLSLPQVFPPL